jgi:predicted nucleic acid-binding protein
VSEHIEQYVLDTSALMQAYVKDEYTFQVKALLATLVGSTPPKLHLLDIAFAEAANVLWKRVYLHKRQSAEIARKSLLNLRALPLIVHETNPLLNKALDLSLEHGLAVYDTLVVALARELSLPLITADRKQEKVALTTGVELKSITEFKSAS